MNRTNKYFTSTGISILLIIVFSFLLNILNYFDILNSSVYKGILLLFLVISIISGSYYLGYKSDNKGYLNGIYFGVIISLLFIIISLIFKEKVTVSSFIYYLIIIIISSIGGTIGINNKTSENDLK